MSKMTKSERITQLEQIAVDQARAFKIMADRLNLIEVESKWIIHMTGIETPKLKQLDQSVFDGLDEKWRWFGVNSDGSTIRAIYKPKINISNNGFILLIGDSEFSDDNYDASNWQTSLIQRDTARELTGSDLAMAMLARGDRWILCGNTTDGFASPCIIDGYRCSEDELGFVLTNGKSIEPRYIYPVNNQGEPLIASEVGL